MRSIQDVGLEVLNNNPASFYVFTGPEYGIKMKYIDMMKEHYGDMKEAKSVKELIDFMSTRHFIPLKPTVYVVRYDEEFISSLSNQVANKIKKTNIAGTIVCLYDSDKHEAKLDKYLGDYTVRLDAVNTVFKIKYLHSDFPKLPDKLIHLAAEHGHDYQDAKNMCSCMNTIPPELLFAMSDDEIIRLFGKSDEQTEAQIKIGVASRNFRVLIDAINNYPGELDGVLYTILSTMIELEKLLGNKYTQSDLRDYVERWNYKDVYNMFMNTYEEVKKLRSYATDVESSLIYLFGLLKFAEIPDVGEML